MTTLRWGNANRDHKAIAILETLRSSIGHGVESGSWLDVGCGSGGIARSLSDHVEKITGIDPNPWPQWEAISKERSNLHFLTGSFDEIQLPFPEKFFDVIICNQVYEHVADPRLLLLNIHRTLKSGGHCYFAGPNLLWPIEPHVYWPFVHWLPRGLAKSTMRALGSRKSDDLDAWSMHYWKLTKLIDLSGLRWRIALRERFSSERNPRMRGRVIRATARLPDWAFRVLAPLSPGFIFLLQKP